MNVLIVSQCDKRALTETRRILDQFAERRGDTTWQTPITKAGLETLRRLLRKTARKNTAVACHWNRSRDHSELLWVVGNASRFNAEGAVPTNTTRRNVLRKADENDWHTGEAIRLLAQMAALLHDLGKASVAFQAKLRHQIREKNLFRHEWVSLRLFLAFVGNEDDATWLRRLASPDAADDASWSDPSRYLRDGLDPNAPPPFIKLPPLAAAIAWLVVTHHRLPTLPVQNDDGSQAWLGKRSLSFSPLQIPQLLKAVGHNWNEVRQPADPKTIETYWALAGPLPVTLPKWRAQASRIAQKLSSLAPSPDPNGWLGNPFVMHLARLSLMLADHHYSSLAPGSPERVRGDAAYSLFANTHEGKLKQPLDEHLLGVARGAGHIVHALPHFEQHLPRLARHRGLRKRSADKRFAWQDKAADAAASLREKAGKNGAFIINMASTGCGKTLANARVMYALSDSQLGMRATFALGLRTLTLQTGRSYRKDLQLGDDELAIRVGGSANRALFEYYEKQAEQSGSASRQALIEEDGHVFYEGTTVSHPLLDKAMRDQKIRSLLSAPMLVCTIDHLMPATEAQRSGRQIAPMLRMMSSDLVLDELDDFDLDDLPALTRLMHWSGMLGTRVMLSSATLPPALVEGMYLAYHAGRAHYQRNRGSHGGQAMCSPDVACLWIDEFGTQVMDCADVSVFSKEHSRFVAGRAAALEKAEPRRRGTLVPLKISATRDEPMRREFAEQVLATAMQAHDAHAETCPNSEKRVSFGLVRMANIEPLFDVAQALFQRGAPEHYRIHLCVYHARFPLLLRSAIEYRLDQALNRRDKDAVYALPDIRQAIDSHSEQNHLFIVLGSPVTEVGRDHDYDWAVVEPSSMRSLIQLAGRVQRHRGKPCTSPNVLVFDTNLRHFKAARDRSNPAPAFLWPGFEHKRGNLDHEFRLLSHRLDKLLRPEEYNPLTAVPRIAPRPQLEWEPKRSLVDLEHARLQDCMSPRRYPSSASTSRRGTPDLPELNAACAWQFPEAALTWVLPQQQPFRDSSVKEVELVFLPDEDEEALRLYRVDEDAGKPGAKLYVEIDKSQKHTIDLQQTMGPRIAPWGDTDLMMLLSDQADAQGLSLRECAMRFATVSVLPSTQGWRYAPALGFATHRPATRASPPKEGENRS